MNCEKCGSKSKVRDSVSTGSETGARKIPNKYKYLGNDITYRHYNCPSCDHKEQTIELKTMDAVRAPFTAVSEFKKTLKQFIDL